MNRPARRALLALLAAGLLAACAAAPRPPARMAVSPYAPLMAPATARQDPVLVGRVLGQMVLSTYLGDVEQDVFSLMIEPGDAPGTTVVVLSQLMDCPRPGDHQRTYRLTLRPRQKPIWFRGQPDPRWASDRVVVTCTAVEG